MRFKLRQMEAFRAVMLTGSMNGAAKLLFISQPAVSRLIAYTEQSLGLQLFERARGKLKPTHEAELLFREVDRLYEEAVRIDELARDLTLRSSGTLDLCSSPSLAINYMPPIVARFLEQYPGVHLRFRTTLTSHMAHELLSRQADVAVSVLPVDHPNLVVEPFAEGRMVCIMPEGHALEQKREVSLAEVAAYPLVLYSRSIPFGQMVSGAFQRAGVEWRVKVDILRAEQACALVRAGVGIAIVDQFSVGDGGWLGISVRQLKEPIPLTLSIVRSRLDRPSRTTRNFTALLKEKSSTACSA
ncbi:LysR substrate-binding domain-containing protein [Xanthobacter sp. V3C-3]|uniref:LysR substrate-binding domain-containing protein n=1 Tax=Xanthobacter lutulentifluminis TaxID=3119935 RepID=UPI003726B5FA